ncbi:MAG TPA: hypothetical protein VGK74_17215 [Symbiobacteriaceae bacterium]
MTLYFERVTAVAWEAAAHIQTSCRPERAASEFSWDHPGFRGLLEVIVQEVIVERPRLTIVLTRVDGPGRTAVISDPFIIDTLGACV